MSDIYKNSLEYHRKPTPGKLSVTPTKPLADQQDLVLAYSPGVAGPCLAIAEDPEQAAFLTTRSNLIAVITNGTAVLGLGAIGPLAAKPVMEGKAVLFKKFAGVDVFDLELQQDDPDKLVETIVALEPTFGGINLEDIKAPECFYIEQKLQERLKIPVFHDDQHGTAIIVAAAVLNALQLLNKDITQVKLVTSGAGAAAIACLDLLVDLGLKLENIIIVDRSGVVYKGRPGALDPSKMRYAQETNARTLKEALTNADIFLGLSTGGVVTKEMIAEMAEQPLILALANPTPEILPDIVREVRPQAIIATGRSDYPNQVNNVLCFPYIFRGALDVGAIKINQEMKIACVHALAKLAQAESSDVVSGAYGGEIHRFGSEYIIPKPFDPRLIVELSSAVAEAATRTGVAIRPLKDIEAYRQRLGEFVYRSNMVMRPIFTQAKKQPMRLTFVEGEEPRILQATQMLIDEGLAHPILIGRPTIIQRQINVLGLRLRPEIDFSWIDPNQDPRYAKYWKTYHKLLEREGVSPDGAKMIVRTDNTVIGALTVYLGDSDAVLCGPNGRYSQHLKHLTDILGLSDGHQVSTALSGLLIDEGVIFICDTYVNANPTSQILTEMVLKAAEQIRRFGIVPKVALLSHSNFGSLRTESSLKMRAALKMIRQRDPDLEIDGEMHADAALSPEIRQRIFPNSTLSGRANLLVMPCLNSANIGYNVIKSLKNGMSIGPLLLGIAKPAHIMTPSITVRGILNLATLAVVEAHSHKENVSLAEETS